MHYIDAKKTYGEKVWQQLHKNAASNIEQVLEAALDKAAPTTYHEVRQTRHAGPFRRSRDKLISDMLWRTPSHGWAKAGQPARIYKQQLCANTDVALKTYQKQWMIETGGRRGSGRSVLAARHDDDDFLKIKRLLLTLRFSETNKTCWL